MKTPRIKTIANLLRSTQSDLQNLILKTREIEKLNNRFQSVLDDSLKKYCLVANAYDQCLVLLVANGSIASQIRFNTPDYLRKFKADLVLKRFKKIECKIRPHQQARPSRQMHKVQPLSAATADLVYEMAESLTDPKLKEIMQRIGKPKLPPK